MEEILAISRSIRNFEILVRHGMIHGEIRIRELLDVYRKIRPSLHPHAAEERILDIDALIYATKRLPANVDSVHTILVKRRVPEDFGTYEGIVPIPTDLRRREAYAIADGLLLMVVQEDVSDVLDLVSLLCTFVVEADKVRAKLGSSGLLAELDGLVAAHRPGEAAAWLSPTVRNRLFAQMAFELGCEEDEIFRLDESWHGGLLGRMHAMAHRGHDLVVRLHGSISTANMDYRARDWAADLDEALEQLGLADRPLHVVSANLHSVVNCLSGFARRPEVAAELAALATDPARRVEGLGLEDLPYYFLRTYLEADPSRSEDLRRVQEGEGIHHLPDRRHTEINVQIVDTARLRLDQLDPRVKADPDYVRREQPVILNFEYAFGEQGGKILGALCERLRHRIRSISIMGKAGTLAGDRGCVMIPAYFIHDGSLDVYDLFVPNGITADEIDDLVPTDVLGGAPMLTVLGTILQSQEMLEYYARTWGMLGLEMEGVPYIKKLKQCHKLGYCREDFQLNIAYYASDNPLRPGETLARGLGVEGMAATYGITLGILRKVLGPGSGRSARTTAEIEAVRLPRET